MKPCSPRIEIEKFPRCLVSASSNSAHIFRARAGELRCRRRPRRHRPFCVSRLRSAEFLVQGFALMLEPFNLSLMKTMRRVGVLPHSGRRWRCTLVCTLEDTHGFDAWVGGATARNHAHTRNTHHTPAQPHMHRSGQHHTRVPISSGKSDTCVPAHVPAAPRVGSQNPCHTASPFEESTHRCRLPCIKRHHVLGCDNATEVQHVTCSVAIYRQL